VQFQVPAPGGAPADDTLTPADATAPIRITQIPGGSFAQLMFGGRQLEPVDFLGGPAFLDVGSLDPSIVSVFWQDDSTVFNATTNALTFADIEAFVGSFEPITADDWNQRFATAQPEPVADSPTCAPQPNFGPTLDP
jgi:hypothetical protein